MNDPHVVALKSKISHGAGIDYDSAEPLKRDEPGFFLTVRDGKARFKFKTHFATMEEALDSIRDYVRKWEFDVKLKWGPDSFGLRSWEPEIVDRAPVPGESIARASIHGGEVRITASATVQASKYPAPPRQLRFDPDDADATSMLKRYLWHLKGREGLPSMAYFCLTMLEYRFPKRKRKCAATTYRIEHAVLQKVGELSSKGGGPLTARKAGAHEIERELYT